MPEKPSQAILYPGTEVVLEFETVGGPMTEKVIVYPVSFKSLQKFTKVLLTASDVVAKMQGTGIPKDLVELAKKDEGAKRDVDRMIIKQMLQALAPFVISECLDLVAECVKGNVEFDQLAHWHIAPIVEAWIKENFGSLGKLKPWIAAIDNLVTHATGKSPNLWENLSGTLSDLDLASMISSGEDSPDSPTME